MVAHVGYVGHIDSERSSLPLIVEKQSPYYMTSKPYHTGTFRFEPQRHGVVLYSSME